SLTPPAFPLPPACTCALTTQRGVLILSAMCAASSTLAATSPLDTGIPYSDNNCFAWYSWRFIVSPTLIYIDVGFRPSRRVPRTLLRAQHNLLLYTLRDAHSVCSSGRTDIHGKSVRPEEPYRFLIRRLEGH